MPNLGHQQMEKVENALELRKHKLEALMSTDFDVSNNTQLKALSAHLDEFELHVNTMYLFQSLSKLTEFYLGSWVLSYLLPLPDIATKLLEYSLYLGLMGKLLLSYSMNDFHQEVREMQAIYNWALKAGAPVYSPIVDNHEILHHPDILRMISLLAPFSSPEFMQAWPSVRDSHAGAGQSLIARAYHYGTSFFPKATVANASAQVRLQQLKEQIEDNDSAVSVLDGLKRAGNYFVSNERLDLVKSRVTGLGQQTIETFSDALPGLAEKAIGRSAARP